MYFSAKNWLKFSKRGIVIVFQIMFLYNIGTWCCNAEDVQSYIVKAKQQFEKVRTACYAEEDTYQITCDNPKFAGNAAPVVLRTKTILDFETYQCSTANFPTDKELLPGGRLLVNGVEYTHLRDNGEGTSIILSPSLAVVSMEERMKYPKDKLLDHCGYPLYWKMSISDSSGKIVSGWDILSRSGQISVERDASGSKIILHSKSSEESMEIELDLTRDCALSRFNYKNETNSIRQSQPSRVVQAPYRMKRVPLTVEYTVNQFGQFRGIYFPLSATFEESYISEMPELVEQGKKVLVHSCKFHDVREEKYSDVDINFEIPPDSLSFLFDVPNYTKVQVNDARQIQYVWVDGKVKPLTDELAEERLRKVKFIPGVAEPRFWMMFVGTLMVVLAVISLIWRYYTDKNGKGKGDDDNE